LFGSEQQKRRYIGIVNLKEREKDASLRLSHQRMTSAKGVFCQVLSRRCTIIPLKMLHKWYN